MIETAKSRSAKARSAKRLAPDSDPRKQSGSAAESNADGETSRPETAGESGRPEADDTATQGSATQGSDSAPRQDSSDTLPLSEAMSLSDTRRIVDGENRRPSPPSSSASTPAAVAPPHADAPTEAGDQSSAETAPSDASPDPSSGGEARSRLDPLSGAWTIFAPQRNQRPDDFCVKHEASTKQEGCPFCQGHEDATPEPVWVGRVEDDEAKIFDPPPSQKQDRLDWSVRVVPNKYPAVSVSVSNNTPAGNQERESDFFQSRPLVGGHEVIVESPHHVESLTELDLAEATLVFRAYQDRIRFWRRDPRIRYISLFKNVGGEAGASLQHGHSQLIAIDRLPKLTADIVNRMRQHRAQTGCCLQCDLVRAELKSKRRIVAQTKSLVAYCPFASRLPMMVRITTKSHAACFGDLPVATVEEVARLTVRIISWLERLCPGRSYNYLLQTCPPGLADGEETFHWSLELFPRLTQIAGFEWSSQCMINPVLPETAAARYRDCAAAEDPRLVL